MGLPSDAETDAYINQQAARLGINPTIAVNISRAERGARSSGWVGDQRSSFGPYQLHYGGVSQANPGSGLGDTFTQKTGLNARDIAGTWRQQIDFVLTTAKNVTGWQPFHAAQQLGYGIWDGIRQTGNTLAQFLYFFPIVGYSGNVKDTYHTPGATDLFAPAGTPIRSVADGRVTVVSSSGPGGNALVIHGMDGLDYYYAHMRDRPLVSSGDYVAGGQLIGNVGNTGNAEGKPPHLHIGIGHGIETGTGANGGTGKGFDAQSFLATILGNGGASQSTRGVAAELGQAAVDLNIAGEIREGAKGVGGDILQQLQNYVQDRAASIAFLSLGILLILAGIWGFAMQNDTVKGAVKMGVSQLGNVGELAAIAI
jgi:murein DD-endopeptidase MepM/ murein hydrolase activator NlpD